jgi:hypothetical protein
LLGALSVHAGASCTSLTNTEHHQCQEVAYHSNKAVARCRRRPFLIRSLENTLVKLILSLEFYDDVGRQKIAIGEPLWFWA